MDLAEAILRCLGEPRNVVSLQSAISRLRVQVNNAALVDIPGLKALGAFGVVISGHVVQIVLGQVADSAAEDIHLLIDEMAVPSVGRWEAEQPAPPEEAAAAGGTPTPPQITVPFVTT
jgi:PTS system N-acetylglucosamine-specific IIB component